MSGKKDGGFAFPGEHSADAEAVKLLRGDTGIGMQDLSKLLSKHGGMSLRDWFAGQALSGMLADEGEAGYKAQTAASRSYELADAMLAERAK